MRVLGIDFTSTPSALKPLRVAQGEFDNGSLRLTEPPKAFRSMADFEHLLASDHEWMAGIDFPFGLPQEFVAEMQWPLEWSTYVEQVGARSREEFCSLLEGYAAGRPEGRKQHLRATDRVANARSPMMVFFTPVAKMFYEGAIRLARSPVSVVPVRPTPDRRIVVEAYPALVAQKVLGKESYKTGRSANAPEALRDARRRLLEHIRAGALSKEYGLQLELSNGLVQACMEDGSGDCLDAVLCAVQAAWGWMNSEHNFGLPCGAESEGWIADPALSYTGVVINSERLGRSFNSSLTRVRPVLQGALKSDPTGETWLGPLLRATSNARALPPSVLKDPGRLRGKNLELRTYADRVAGPRVLERCFELPVPPPASFLRWLLRHPNEMVWPVDRTGRPQTFGAVTQAKRENLLGRHGNDAQRQAQAEALDALISAGTEGSAGKWWAFEGFTEIDCCLETDRLLFFIEGKRTETLSESTAWYHGRNQLIRNLETATEMADGRAVGVVVIGEDHVGPLTPTAIAASLPHFEAAERHALMRHYLGSMTWREVCAVLGVNFVSLPNTAAEASGVRAQNSVLPDESV